MDQEYVSTSAGHYMRLALILLASVFGLVLLGLVFGDSAARADDGGPDGDGLVPAVVEVAGDTLDTVAPAVSAVVPGDTPVLSSVTSTVSETVAPVAHIAAPVTEVADRTLTKVLAPVVTVIDTVVGVVADSVGPVLGVPPRSAPSDAVIAATASLVSPQAAAAISGTAIGVWFGSSDPLGGTTHVSGTTVSGIALPAAALGLGFLVLLFSRRLRAVNTALPVSPCYETDTSPD